MIRLTCTVILSLTATRAASPASEDESHNLMCGDGLDLRSKLREFPLTIWAVEVSKGRGILINT